MRAARRQPVGRPPLWLMRQAGRVLPEYRAIRQQAGLLEITRRPELCAEVTLQPLRRFPLDAAIIFADIMSPLVGVGVDLELVEGVGPVIAAPIVDQSGLQQLRPLEPATDVPTLLEAIRLVRRELSPDRALIGFAGAPFTLASYLVEGRPSRDFLRTKTMMYARPDLWQELMERLTSITIAYLQAQAQAGADVLQLFDSWVGALAPDDYAAWVQPYTRRIFAALAATGCPLIHFGTNTAGLLTLMRTDGATIIGVDWRLPLDVAWRQIGEQHGIQGNLDPAVLLAPPAIIAAQTRAVLRRAAGRPGHIFNLGHGLLPTTPLAAIERLIEVVHSYQLDEEA